MKKKLLSRKRKQAFWRAVLIFGLVCEFVLIGMAVDSLVKQGETIPHWQAITFMAIAVWVYIAYLKQRSIDISKFVVDEKIKTHLLAQHLAEGLILLDDADRVLLWNLRAAAVTGVAELQVLNRPIGDFIEPDRPDWLNPGRSGECRGKVRETERQVLLKVIHLERDDDATGQKLIYVRPGAAPAKGGEDAGPARLAPCILQSAVTAEKLAGAAPPNVGMADGLRLGLDLRSLYLKTLGPANFALPAHEGGMSMSVLIREVLEAVGGIAAAGKVRLPDAPQDEGLRLQGDPAWVRAAVLQAVLNAVICSEPGAEVMLKTAPMGNYTGLVVVDSVPTPAADKMPPVFDWPYAGLPDDAGQIMRAQGLGLFLARSVVEKLGGVLSVEPRPDGGMAVTLLLPG